MSGPSRDDLFALALAQAERVLIGKPGAEIVPMWLVIYPQGALLCPTPFHGEQSKDAVAGAIRNLMRGVGATQYSLVTEAWMAEGKADLPPAKRSDRVEVVMILVADHDGSTMRSYEIIRDWDSGVVTELKSKGESEDGMAMGRFSDLLSAG